jgi:hypothetical protein
MIIMGNRIAPQEVHLAISLFPSGNPNVPSVQTGGGGVSSPFPIDVFNASGQSSTAFCLPVAASFNDDQGTPTASFLGTVGLTPNSGKVTPVQFNWPAGLFTKLYIGFDWSTYPATDAGASQFFAAYPQPGNDSWFLGAAQDCPIAGVYKFGCITVTLSDQTDPNPPHNVHPMIDTSGAWDATNPLLTILNQDTTGANVIMYVRLFDINQQPAGDYPYRVPGQVCTFSIPSSPSLWYGFAFEGNYNTPGDYFTAHPGGQDAHHTGSIEQ